MKPVLWMAFTIASAAGLAIFLTEFFHGRFPALLGIVLFLYLLICTLFGMRWDPPKSGDHRHHDH